MRFGVVGGGFAYRADLLAWSSRPVRTAHREEATECCPEPPKAPASTQRRTVIGGTHLPSDADFRMSAIQEGPKTAQPREMGWIAGRGGRKLDIKEGLVNQPVNSRCLALLPLKATRTPEQSQTTNQTISMRHIVIAVDGTAKVGRGDMIVEENTNVYRTKICIENSHEAKLYSLYLPGVGTAGWQGKRLFDQFTGSGAFPSYHAS